MTRDRGEEATAGTDLRHLSREALEAEVLRLRARDEAHGRAFGSPVRSTPAGRDELVSAIEKTRTPMILTDPNQPDDPIVFANRAFMDLSGYSAEELIGRNCRFLQGPETDPSQVQRIREALAAKREIAIDLVNYRRDGTSFVNELFISPILGPDGDVLYHFGSQLDVTGHRRDRRALEHSERRQRAVFASALDVAIIVTDRQGTVTDWNTGAERILGWSAREMRGQTADRCFTPEDRVQDWGAAEMDRALAQGRVSDERWNLRKDGSRFWAFGEVMPLRDDDGRHVGFTKILRDRTDDHLTARALEEAETRLRRAQEAGGIGLFTVDLTPTAADDILRPTPEFCRLYGLPVRDSHPAKLFEERVVPEDVHLVSSSTSRRSGEIVPDAEYRIRRADDGEERWIARKGVIEHDVQGAPVRFFGVARDITEHRADRDALVLSEARYRALFDAVDDGFCVIEFFDGPHGPLSDYVHVEANSGYERHTGIAGIVGRTLRDLAPAEADAWAALYGDVLRTGRPARFEREFVTAGRHIEVSAARIEPASRRQVLVLFRDISARRQAEVALRASEALVREHAETLEQRVAERTADLMKTEAALRQSQKMEAVGQLTGGLAHDFNNLLAGISGSLDLMGTRLSQGRLKDIEKYMVAAQGAAKRAAALTHRLLAFSRRQTLAPKPTDVNRLVHGMEELIQRTVGPHIAVVTVGASSLWTALVDPPQLENALLNLCINARDAMPDGGRITIETANRWIDKDAARQHDMPEGQFLSLCVTDTGVGMDRDLIAKVFEPFFTTKPIGEGTGLGLSMIYGFAQQSGGQVRIYSEVGQGTTVCIYLPRHYGEADIEHAPADRAASTFAESGETVLIVDDEPTIRMLVTDVLEDLGYTAIEAADSVAGLKVLQSDVRIDLLVTDVGLPGGMNGRQMADAGRERRPDLKVLFITGYAENAVLNHGQLAPFMQVLTKPFAVDALAVRIRELVGGGDGKRQS